MISQAETKSRRDVLTLAPAALGSAALLSLPIPTQAADAAPVGLGANDPDSDLWALWKAVEAIEQGPWPETEEESNALCDRQAALALQAAQMPAHGVLGILAKLSIAHLYHKLDEPLEGEPRLVAPHLLIAALKDAKHIAAKDGAAS